MGYSPWGRKEQDMTEHTLTHHTLGAVRLLKETSAIYGPIPVGFLSFFFFFLFALQYCIGWGTRVYPLGFL